MFQLKRLKKGTLLLKIFIFLLIVDAGILAWFIASKNIVWELVIFLTIIESIIFWAGIILAYISSVQLGIKTRVLGIILGWVPIANIIMLLKIVGICSREIKTETELIKRDSLRHYQKVCKTKYPILLVHGVFFRDSEHLNYWGRIPAELEKNGATIFYGEHNSAAAVKDSAVELEKKINEIIEKTGCEKVNIIAHSKGGLDSRVLISNSDKYVASLTTINTPHRGCEFADYFLGKIPVDVQNKIAAKYNSVASRLGDVNPDFLAAVTDLTASACRARNEEIKDSPNVYYQSVGSTLQKATSGKFPLNFTHPLVKYFDGENDGLVGIDSFPWGEKFILEKNEKTKRGISHADMIDLNRENIDGFDVREFYINLVKELKEKGF